MTLPGEFNQVIIAYTTDDGVVMTTSQKIGMAQAVNNPIVAMRSNQGIPERWQYRHIRIVTVYGGTIYWRRCVISNPNNPIFVGTQKTINIQGVVWQIWERKGESRRGPFHS